MVLLGVAFDYKKEYSVTDNPGKIAASNRYHTSYTAVGEKIYECWRFYD